HPVGNGPFRFVSHEPRRRWVFAADSTFPAALGGPPRLERFVVVVVDEPSTKLAALTSGEVDFAGIQPAHAALVRRDARLAVLDYPLILPYGIVLNLRRPPFDDRRVRLALALALARVHARGPDFAPGALGTPGDPGLAYLAPLAQVAGLTIPPEPAAAQRRFADSLPVVFLYHARGVQGMNRRVRGVRMDRRGELANIAEWWIAP